MQPLRHHAAPYRQQTFLKIFLETFFLETSSKQLRLVSDNLTRLSVDPCLVVAFE